MALPTTRDEFKKYCLRQLGWPVVGMNLNDDQIDDRIDEALSYYADYHFDGSEKVYYKHQVSQTDKDNKYITVPDNVLGAVNVFPINFSSSSSDAGIFSIQYQIMLNELYTLTSQSMIPYVMAMQHLEFLEQILVGQKPIRFNRNMNRVYLDMNWDLVEPGVFLVIEAYQVVDPTQYAHVWKDRWLGRYAATLIKQQWGTNLKKLKGVKLPGGVELNGQDIYNEATIERAVLEKEMIFSYSLPVTDMIG